MTTACGADDGGSRRQVAPWPSQSPSHPTGQARSGVDYCTPCSCVPLERSREVCAQCACALLFETTALIIRRVCALSGAPPAQLETWITDAIQNHQMTGDESQFERYVIRCAPPPGACARTAAWHDGWAPSYYYVATTLSSVGYGDILPSRAGHERGFGATRPHA